MAEPNPHDPHDKLWLAIALRGVVALAFGVVALSSVRVTVLRLSVMFALYAVVDGALALYGASRVARAHERAPLLAIDGLTSLVAAVLVIVLREPLWIQIAGGVRAVIGGACEMGWSFRRRSRAVPIMTGLGGVCAVLLGLLILAWPGPAVIALPWLLGLAAMVPGALLVGGALTWLRDESDAAHTAG